MSRRKCIHNQITIARIENRKKKKSHTGMSKITQ